MRAEQALVAALAISAACSRAPAPPQPQSVPSSATPAASSAVSGAAALALAGDGGGGGVGEDAGAGAPPSRAASEPAIAPREAAMLLFPDGSAPPCEAVLDRDRVRCLVAARFAGDDAARAVAVDLYARTGSVAGLETEHVMDGGYRGSIHLVPALPVGGDRVHLERVAAALVGYDAFFRAFARGAPGEVEAPAFRFRALALRFVRSVKKRTPSAYASGWTVAYNVAGSLNGSAESVRELLFHEVFHSNDQAHGDWSDRALSAIYGGIVARCGARAACLAPYAPTETMVRGGTYYAFQPGNDVREYAAELAVRYYREQRGALGQGPRVAAFKCGTAENARAWEGLAREFFGGIDHVPACGAR